jgi:hypothetical protein
LFPIPIGDQQIEYILQLLICNRPAIHLSDIVVSFRNRCFRAFFASSVVGRNSVSSVTFCSNSDFAWIPVFDTHAINKSTKGGEKGRMEKAMKPVEVCGEVRLVRRPFIRPFHPAKHLISSGRQPIPVYSTGVGVPPVSILLFRDYPPICVRLSRTAGSVAKKSAPPGPLPSTPPPNPGKSG